MGGKKSFVKDYMTKNVISVSPDTETESIIELMKESRHKSKEQPHGRGLEE